MGSIAWTEEANRWLQGIHEFIALDNPAAANRVVRGIYDRAQVLVQHPEIGYRYHASERHVRVLLYGHYRIAYLVKTSRDIDTLGAFHGALDIERYSL